MRFVKVKIDGVEVSTGVPVPGTKWMPLHRTPNGPKKAITIRRFIAQQDEKKKTL